MALIYTFTLPQVGDLSAKTFLNCNLCRHSRMFTCPDGPFFVVLRCLRISNTDQPVKAHRCRCNSLFLVKLTDSCIVLLSNLKVETGCLQFPFSISSSLPTSFLSQSCLTPLLQRKCAAVQSTMEMSHSLSIMCVFDSFL